MSRFTKFISVLLVALVLSASLSVTSLALDADTVAVVSYTGEDGQVHNDEYTSFATALSNANAGKTVYLIKSTNLASNATIQAGAKVVIPTSENYTADNTTTGNNVNNNGTTGNAYVTLTIDSGSKLTVDGTLLVAGNQQSTQPRSGFLTGNYGAVNLLGEMELNTGAELYARGEIYGSGKITARSGSHVYQRFQIYDWRGGTESQRAYNNNAFPFSLYQLAGISATTVYEKGAVLDGQTYIYASYTPNNVTVNFIGDGALVSFSGDDGNITFDYNNGVTSVTLNADVSTNNLVFSISILGFTYSIDSDGLDCPFGYMMNVVIGDGASLTINNYLKVLPGCKITVANGGTLNVSSDYAINFYGADTYKKDYYFGNAATWNYSNAAELVNLGGVVVDNGDVGSTDATFANVDGFVNSGATTPVYEYIQGTNTETIVDFYVGTPDTTTPPTPAE